MTELESLQAAAARAAALRYKKPALSSMGFEAMRSELQHIVDDCGEVEFYSDVDVEKLYDVFGGDTEEASEFLLAFSHLSAQAEDLLELIYDEGVEENYDDCTVALIGNRYELVGYDDFEEDYMSLVSYQQDLAETEAGKRLMRLTKKDMIATIGQCFGTLMAFLDLRYQYDYLKATLDILREKNNSLLDTVNRIGAVYETFATSTDHDEQHKAERELDHLVLSLPDTVWVS